MNPMTAAALVSRMTSTKKPEPWPSSADAQPGLVPPKPQVAAAAAPEAPPAPAAAPPSYEALQDLVAAPGGIAALRAAASAYVSSMPRREKPKLEPVTFQPTDPVIVAERVALALEALDGLALDPPKGVTCHQRRWANKVGYALGAARRELERAKVLAEDRPA
jgi:hypothetical protein